MPSSSLTIHLRHSPAFTVQSHGWCHLAPFHHEGNRLDWAARLPRAGVRRISVRWSGKSDALRVVVSGRKIGKADRQFVRSRVRWMFRADEDFSDFWDLCRGHAVLRHCGKRRTGALLRCPTVFEDVVKTICTTNCSWWNTKLMVANLCRMFGESCAGDDELFTFPAPERLAQASETDLKEAKLGFRARYVGELARRVAEGQLDLDAWCEESESDVLRSSLLGVKGVGPYGANHLLMLLGYYGNIPCDSEVREYLGVPSKASQREVERVASKRYGSWGRYAFLAYKFERVFIKRNYVDWCDGVKK